MANELNLVAMAPRGHSKRTFVSVARNFSYLIGRKNGPGRAALLMGGYGPSGLTVAAAAVFQTFFFSSLPLSFSVSRGSQEVPRLKREFSVGK